MDSQNTGSFGAALGGIDALKASMQSRGIDTSALDQVSAAAPGEQRSPGSLPSNVPQLSSSDQMVANDIAQPQLPTPQTLNPQAQFRSAEAEIATKALKSVIDTDNAIAKQSLGIK